jgi:hypothetical protein
VGSANPRENREFVRKLALKQASAEHEKADGVVRSVSRSSSLRVTTVPVGDDLF